MHSVNQAKVGAVLIVTEAREQWKIPKVFATLHFTVFDDLEVQELHFPFPELTFPEQQKLLLSNIKVVYITAGKAACCNSSWKKAYVGTIHTAYQCTETWRKSLFGCEVTGRSSIDIKKDVLGSISPAASQYMIHEGKEAMPVVPEGMRSSWIVENKFIKHPPRTFEYDAVKYLEKSLVCP